MEIAMTIQPIAITLLTLLLTGCASQSEVNDLKKQIESMKTERAQRQQTLQREIDQAQTDLDRCKVSADVAFDDNWKINSRPEKGSNTRWGNRDMLNHLREEQHRAYADCQRDYENALQKAKLLYGIS
jgi:outer membrane murein-binding lipoprotein Lpp